MRENSFITPALLIILGLVFLLNNFGVLPWEVWSTLWKFWPVLLILVGAEILLGKRASIKTFLILFALIFLAPIIISYNPLTNNPLSTEEFEIEESLGTAIKAKINLDLPASNIEIKALQDDSAFLAQGKVVYSEAAKKLEIKKTLDAGTLTLDLTQSTQGKLPFISNLKTNVGLSLTSLIPLEILIKTGASSANIDISKLKSEYLEVNSGASTLTIKLAPDFSQKILVKTAASAVTVEIPEKLAAKVVVDSQIKSVAAPKRFEKSDNSYQTKGFEKASTKAEIQIKATAGSLVIK